MDADLAFIRELSNEELGDFVEILVKKGGVTETLTTSREYRLYKTNYCRYADRIEQEYRMYGSNSILTLLCGPNKYRDILCDTAKQLKVSFREEDTVYEIEQNMLESVMGRVWESMNEKDKAAFQENLTELAGPSQTIWSRPSFALGMILQAGGLVAYQLTRLFTSAFTTALIGRGLATGTSLLASRGLGLLMGPVGLVVTTLWTAIDLAGPAYRVTIPCTILLAAYRRMHEYEKQS